MTLKKQMDDKKCLKIQLYQKVVFDTVLNFSNVEMVYNLPLHSLPNRYFGFVPHAFVYFLKTYFTAVMIPQRSLMLFSCRNDNDFENCLVC